MGYDTQLKTGQGTRNILYAERRTATRAQDFSNASRYPSELTRDLIGCATRDFLAKLRTAPTDQPIHWNSEVGPSGREFHGAGLWVRRGIPGYISG